MREQHDVVIVGAGPGGAATAYYLARAGLDVLLLDKAGFPRDKTCGDGLAPRALGVLREIGLLPELQRVGFRVDEMRVVGPGGAQMDAPFPSRPDALPFSLVVPRRTLDALNVSRAVVAGARLHEGMHVAGIRRVGQLIEVDGQRAGQRAHYAARLVVVATGASSGLLLRSGILRHAPPTALATRAYFDGVRDLGSRVHFRFDDVPLPGYGWLFPTGADSANVGLGVFPGGWRGQHAPTSPRPAFDAFVAAPRLQPLLGDARRVGPVKGYPLRVDFATARTWAPGVMLVGEAAGLVNPITGEGVDYALESGQLAAAQIVAMWQDGDWSPARLAAYDHALRQRFQRIFLFCSWTRQLFVNPWLFDRLLRSAERRPAFKAQLIDLVLGNESPALVVSLGSLLRAAVA